MVQTPFNSEIQSLQTDWGEEYRNVSKYLSSHGIIHRVSYPYMQEQNGAVNCKNCIIIEKGLTLLAQSFLRHTFREHAFKTATYLHNRHITHVLTFLSPYQKLYSKVPNYAFIKTFDFLCYPFLCPYNNHNIDFHSLPCVFLSYSATHKGYICFHTPFSRIYVARHVIFNEDVFLYSKNTLLSPTVSPTPSTLVSTNLSQQVTIISSTNSDNPSPTLITLHLLRLLIAPNFLTFHHSNRHLFSYSSPSNTYC